MKTKWKTAMVVVLALAAIIAGIIWARRVPVYQWQQAVSPGALSQGHADLERNCAACHTASRGTEAANCIVCHANNVSLLQRQPTAFHADIGNCADCHHEHQGRSPGITPMDHATFASIAHRQLKEAASGSESAALARALAPSVRDRSPSPSNAHLTTAEAALHCAACHGKQDKHYAHFGSDCAQCHATTAWTLPEFHHPAPTSRDCAQCHQAPPSHSMMHFHMVSMAVAGVEHADVRECYLCHQTTSWNDIRGVGFYKHH
jgi:hypothetical protein